MIPRLNQHPSPRTVDGVKLWQARIRFPDGTRPAFGVYSRKRDAQDAMDEAWAKWHGRLQGNAITVSQYAETWTQRHPRSQRTNKTNDHRISRVLGVRVEGRLFRDWPMRELKRRHTNELVGAMLEKQARSVSGTRNILRTLHAMFEDAITDEVCETNPVAGVVVRQGDPRATKQGRRPRVYTFAQMHALARAAGKYEPMIRVLSDCGLRLGELLALHRSDLCGGCEEGVGAHLHCSRNAHDGVITEGDQATKRHVKIVPLAPSTLALLKAMPTRIDSPLLFPTSTGLCWWETNWRRTVWNPAREDAGMPDARPHDFRHSWVTRMAKALGEHHSADLADAAGHSVETMTARYTHPLGEVHDKMRAVIG